MYFSNKLSDQYFAKLKFTPNTFITSAPGRTWITNTGVKHLCLDSEQEAGRGQVSIYRKVGKRGEPMFSTLRGCHWR
jgi:hypothetical protein